MLGIATSLMVLATFALFERGAMAEMGLPLAATEAAHHYDALYSFLVWISVFFTVLIVGGMIYLAYKYRRGRPGNTKLITDNHTLEILWTIIPTIMLLGIFAWGYKVYLLQTQAPASAYEIRVVGKQWSWTFQYPNGKITNELYAPLNKPVKLIMSSEDVLHSFFIPNFRVKQDVVPGMYTSVWFEANVPGKHQVFCAEYCGGSHSLMITDLLILDDQQWMDFIEKDKEFTNLARADGKPDLRMVKNTEPSGAASGGSMGGLSLEGKKLFESRGCVACHSVDGSKKIGPTLKGVFGHEVKFVDGKTAKVDENYIRESIEDPAAHIVEGFAPTMPTFKGQFKETEMNALISYIKELK